MRLDFVTKAVYNSIFSSGPKEKQGRDDGQVVMMVVAVAVRGRKVLWAEDSERGKSA